MAAEIPNYEPQRLRAGDTWRWTKTLSDYPADTWTLTYVLLDETGGSNKITINTAANASAHEVNVSAATTANYNVANYRVAAYVSDGTNRYTLDELDGMRFQVLPDPATVTSSDERTDAEKILANLITAQTALASGTIQSASENGKSYSKYNRKELADDIGKWRLIVWTEQQNRRRVLGKRDNSIIRHSFSKPS